jgi:prepilin-type N-terminal cleavage/methylation domain-containing protein
MLSNSKGFSLVEMVIAMVIILVSILGLFQATLLSIDSNVTNLLRDEAVRLAEERMDRLKSLPVTDESLPPGVNQCDAVQVKRNLRNLTESYQVCTTIIDLNGDTTRKSVQVIVGWDHKKENAVKAPTNKEFQYSMTSMVVNPT